MSCRSNCREDLDITEHFRARFEPLFAVPGTIEEIEYPGFVRGILGDFGVEVSDEELNRFLDAEHKAWAPARRLGATTYALLEALRARAATPALDGSSTSRPAAGNTRQSYVRHARGRWA